MLITYMLLGVMATAGMTMFLWAISSFTKTNVDMISALGSLYTKTEENAVVPGLLIHFTAGTFFSLAYIYFFKVLPMESPFALFFILPGMFLGFIHGIIVSLLLVVLVAEYHPLPKFREAGLPVAIYHFLAHIVYGGTIGLLYSVL